MPEGFFIAVIVLIFVKNRRIAGNFLPRTVSTGLHQDYAQTSWLDQSRVCPVDKSDLPWYILSVAEIAAYNLVYQFHNIWSITFLFDKSR